MNRYPLWTTDRRKLVAHELTLTRIPRGLEWARFGVPALAERVDGDALAALMKLEQVPPMLVLRGGAGAGKSSCAAALLHREVERTAEAGLFVDAYALSIARTDAPLGETPWLEEEARTRPVVVIDDLASERAVPTSPVAHVIFARHAAELPTIVTTWATSAQIAARYGDGIARRLFERSLVVELKGRRR